MDKSLILIFQHHQKILEVAIVATVVVLNFIVNVLPVVFIVLQDVVTAILVKITYNMKVLDKKQLHKH